MKFVAYNCHEIVKCMSLREIDLTTPICTGIAPLWCVYGDGQQKRREPGKVHAVEFQDRLRSATVVLGVALGERLPLLWQIVQGKDRRHRAHRHASATIDALDGIDVEHFFLGERRFVLLRMDTIHGAGIDASSVLRPDARFCDYICHKLSVSPDVRLVMETHILARMSAAVQASGAISAGMQVRRPLMPAPVPAPRSAHIPQCNPPPRSPRPLKDWQDTSVPGRCGRGNCGSAR